MEDILPWCARVRESTPLLAPALEEATLASGWRAGLFMLGYLIQAAWNASATHRQGGIQRQSGAQLRPTTDTLMVPSNLLGTINGGSRC